MDMTKDELQFNLKYPLYLDKRNKTNNKQIMCKECRKTYLKSNKHNHERTNYHKLYEKLNNKLRELLADN